MEHHHMLNILSVLYQQRVNKELSLKELLFVDRAVEKTLKLQIPEEVSFEFSGKEMELKVSSKVVKYGFEGVRLSHEEVSNRSMEKLKVFVESIKNSMEYL